MKTTNFKAIIAGVEVEIESIVTCDPNYGADADGHRGTEEYFIEEVGIFVEGKEITELVDPKHNDLIDQLAIEEYIRNQY